MNKNKNQSIKSSLRRAREGVSKALADLEKLEADKDVAISTPIGRIYHQLNDIALPCLDGALAEINSSDNG